MHSIEWFYKRNFRKNEEVTFFFQKWKRNFFRNFWKKRNFLVLKLRFESLETKNVAEPARFFLFSFLLILFNFLEGTFTFTHSIISKKKINIITSTQHMSSNNYHLRPRSSITKTKRRNIIKYFVIFKKILLFFCFSVIKNHCEAWEISKPKQTLKYSCVSSPLILVLLIHI